LPYFTRCLPEGAHGKLTVRAFVDAGQISVSVVNTDLPASVVDCMARAKPAIAWTGKGSMEAAFIY